MKQCEYCGKQYNDDVNVCVLDGSQLTPIRESQSPPAKHELHKPNQPRRWPATLIVLAALPLIAWAAFKFGRLLNTDAPGKFQTAPPSAVLKVPLMGKWRISGMPTDLFYVFSESNGVGRITFAKEGFPVPLNEREFAATNSNTIIIRNGTKGSFDDELYTAKEMLAILGLVNAPTELSFSGSGDMLEMHGLFGRHPVVLVRSGAKSGADYRDLFVETRPTYCPPNWRSSDKLFLASQPGLDETRARLRLPKVMGIRSAYGTSPIVLCGATNDAKNVRLYAGGDTSYAEAFSVDAKSFPVNFLDDGNVEPFVQQNLLGGINSARWPLTVMIEYSDGEKWVATFALRRSSK